MRTRRLICMILIILFCAGGFYVAVHLGELHYKKPKHQMNLINTLPFMEKWFPRDEVQKALESESLPETEEQIDPFLNPDFDPYDNVAIQDNNVTNASTFEKKEACDISEEFSCSIVDDSDYSEIFGIAIGAYGIIGYLIMILFCLIHLVRWREKSDFFAFLVYCGSWIGFIFSIYLTILEAFYIHSYCPYCLVSAALMTLTFICAIVGFGIEPPAMFFKCEIFPTSLLRLFRAKK
ncbi:MAG TPA: vitamin K epoxide reductase family protein [bacterium]|nr:vitamin K epoxide reductase family protein [bacterium]